MPKIKNWSRVDEGELEKLTGKSRETIKKLEARDSGSHLEFKVGWSNDRFPFVKVYIYKSLKYDEYDVTIRIFNEKAFCHRDNMSGFETYQEAYDRAIEYLKGLSGGYRRELYQVQLPDEFEVHEKYNFRRVSNKEYRKLGYHYDPTPREMSGQVLPRRCKKTLEDFLTLYHGIRDQMDLTYSVSLDELRDYREWRGDSHLEDEPTEEYMNHLERYVSWVKATQSSATNSYEIGSAGNGLAKIERLAKENKE